MKLSIASLLVVGASASASSSIKANSKTGQKMLSKARRLDGGNDNMSWAAGYSLRFEKCATTSDYYGGYFGGNNDNNNNNNQANYNGLYEQRLVHFKLCPSDTCSSSCSGGGDYVIDMNEFVQAYLEYKAEAMEAQCESVKNNCYCENANDDDACEYQCYMNAGIYEDCVEQDNNNNNNNNNGQEEEEFELEEALECAKLEVDEEAAQYYAYQNGNANNANYNYNQNGNNNNNNNGQQEVEFFVGPYCSTNGKSILLGVFMDETCSYSAPKGVYEQFHYGKALPYSSESIISNDCISCLQPAEEDENNNNNNNNNNNQNYNYNNGDGNNYNYNNNDQDQEEPEVLEFCEQLYEVAGKCETNLNAYNKWPNTMACDFIKGLKASGKTRIFASLASAGKNHTAGVLAGVFAVTTAAFGGVAYFFHKKLQRQSVGLVHSQGNMA